MALLGKYHPEAVDYISMCCCDDMDANVLAVKEAVKTLFDIELPFDSYQEWAELSEGSRVEYLAKIVNFIKNDKAKLKNILFNQLRAAGTLAHKRKAIHSQVSYYLLLLFIIVIIYYYYCYYLLLFIIVIIIIYCCYVIVTAGGCGSGLKLLEAVIIVIIIIIVIVIIIMINSICILIIYTYIV
ncbi:unnamed protein product [Anisakis simplex]|uniref:Uncharacterized protein n=1 Tax=Anisakis simplex TaxID=6269 RepID=A0A0M3JC10_ANISI|nr:unnamed protein product [Anisakis simplex]